MSITSRKIDVCKCDSCAKEQDVQMVSEVPEGWYKLRKGKPDMDSNYVAYTHHFCSVECLCDWVGKQVNEDLKDS